MHHHQTFFSTTFASQQRLAPANSMARAHDLGAAFSIEPSMLQRTSNQQRLVFQDQPSPLWINNSSNLTEEPPEAAFSPMIDTSNNVTMVRAEHVPPVIYCSDMKEAARQFHLMNWDVVL